MDVNLVGPIAMLLSALPVLGNAQPIGRSFDSLEAMAADSALVVRGRLLSVAARPLLSLPNDWSEVTLRADGYLKGTGPKVLAFRIRGASSGDPRLSNYVKRGTPLLVFLSESVRFGSRLASRSRYAPRSGFDKGSFLDLSPGAPPQVMTPDFKAVVGPTAILSRARSAIVATRGGRFRIEMSQVPQEQVPKGYEGPWVYLSVPVPIGPNEEPRPDQSPRFSPDAQFDGRRILAAQGKVVRLWDAFTGQLVREFRGSEEDVQAVSFCPARHFDPVGGRVLTASGRPRGILGGSKDNTIREWDVATGVASKRFGPAMGPLEKVEYLPDGDRFLSLSEESSSSDRHRQRIWEEFGQTEVALIPGFGAVSSPDGSMIASRADIRIADTVFAGVWETHTFLQLCTLPWGFYDSLSFSSYGNRLVTTSSRFDGALKVQADVWDAETGRKLLSLGDTRAFQASFTSDSARIVTAERDRGIDVWDAFTGTRLRSIELPKAARSFLLSPDGKRCLAKWGQWWNYGDDEGATLLDLDTGKHLLTLQGNAASLVGFSPDGKTLFAFDSPDRHAGTVWNAQTGGIERKLTLQVP